MLIVIEGPDRVGKSTLVNEVRRQIIAQHRNAVSFHRGAPKPGDHPLTDYALPISVYTPAKHATSIVADRLHLGDLTYGPIYRGECRQTAEMVHFTNALIDTRGGVKVHVTADPELIRARIRDEGEENSYLKIKDVENVVDTYRQVCDVGWIDIDTTTWSTPADTTKVARVLVDLAKEQEETVAPIFQVDDNYVGPVRPRTLFIGNDNTALHSQPAYGAFTPWEDTASEYLVNALGQAGLDLSYDVGMTTTACPDLPTLHARLGQPRLVVLSEVAWLKVQESRPRLTVSHQLNHPALEMHTSPTDHSSYANMLKRTVPPAPTKGRTTAAQAFGG